ncbi:sensor histidine kinase [Rathayibacter iranicus]|uniref:histidine kinase n=2 Tax=Rathayibacter iranicus TaxID=59737 RepID=A0AAD1ACY6_9MICO|nr:HAMP domain-containing sensor histidine kinase [Rathayibacter iranicus]AZZ55908.1 HAMP domain-containing protein [Rathayibacter iranicus]MWV30644.1 HAMP domain-containing protein [Rathayibacter iranicus NCPPB 2253 = VKM Ac-1602]PPI47232.1 sensor histidine kinase [Rathayibacter iranicus]PPI60275.1 sensor histidine kinase [Rathayibacter iranicus]PPI71739.1 sensor histidine kinase [Rathayibacter iranicus]
MHQGLAERWNSISLRTKITAVTVLLLTLGLLVSGIGTMTMLKPQLVAQLDAQLADQVQKTASELSVRDLAAIDDSKADFGAVYDQYGGLDNTNASGAADPAFPKTFTLEQALQGGDKPMEIWSSNGKVEYHVMSTVFTRGAEYQTLLLAVSTRDVDNIMTIYLTIFLGFGVAIVVIGALLTRLLVTTTFAPLREVEQTAAAIADGDFSQRLDGTTPNTEVGRLNRSLNAMLGRIDSAFRDRARTIDQMRRFVGDASHELRTPLVSVRGYAELYRMGALQTPEAVGQAMERIEKEAIRMGGLVEDLLELARLDETKPLALAPVDLMPLARDAAMDAMASWPDRDFGVETRDDTPVETPALEHEEDDFVPPQTIEFANPGLTGPIAAAGARLARFRRRPRRVKAEEIAAGAAVAVPEDAGAPALVMAEENKIRQVLTNLIGNAVRYTPEDTPIEVGVAVDRSRRLALLEVIDHGEGIPPQIREKIFQRFWRADTSRTRETGGSGLGLAIVSSIVTAHKGRVDVVETPGGGATFRVALPLLTVGQNGETSPASV